MKNPQPAIILAGPRTGGTFLACCLSNHPDIYCTRGEPFHRGSRWGVACQDQTERLKLIWCQQHYRACMCKLMHNHASREQVWQCIIEYEPQVKIIYLTRENIVEQSVSVAINIAQRSGKVCDHPTHTFEQVHPTPATLDPYDVFNWCRSLTQRQGDWSQRFQESGLPVLHVTYEQMTRGVETSSIANSATEEICQFLEVPYREMYSDMRKLHRGTMAETVANWDEVVAFLQQTDFADNVNEGLQ